MSYANRSERLQREIDDGWRIESETPEERAIS